MGSYNWKQLPRGNLKERLYIQLQKKIISFQKAPNFCGPEHEDSVAKQTLNDDSCLVACDGLYADITDDSLQQKTMEGVNHLSLFLHFLKDITSGFLTFTYQTPETVQQFFSGSADVKEDGLESFRQHYKSYKESYAKYMEFDPDDPNLS